MNTLSAREKKLITHLRNDSREKLTTLSRKINMPVSTIHEKIKKYQGTIINKSTILLNSSQIGFPLKTHTILSVHKDHKAELIDFLNKSMNVNNLFRINNGFDVIFDAYFENINKSEEFFEDLEEAHKVKKRDTFYILEEVKREGFMSNVFLEL